MTTTITVEEAGSQLPQLLERLAAGEEEFVISHAGKPVARLVALPEPQEPNKRLKRRRPGSAKGIITIPPEFYDPLPDDILDAFER